MREITFCGDSLTKQAQRDLLHAYKAAGVKRFHYCNAGELDYTHFKWLISYYTYIIGYTQNAISGIIYMHVNPYVFLKSRYIDSRTTKRQTNRWLKETGFNFSMNSLETVYQNASHGYASYPLMHGDDFVLPYFNHTQTYLGDNDLHKLHAVVINKVPYLKYSKDNKSLICVGESIKTDNTFYVRYFR